MHNYIEKLCALYYEHIFRWVFIISDPDCNRKEITCDWESISNELHNINLAWLAPYYRRIHEQSLTEMDNPIHDLEEELLTCKQKIIELILENEELGKATKQLEDINYNKIPDESTRSMSGEVSSENRYSRLMALQKMGVVSDYTRILQCSAVIIGIGKNNVLAIRTNVLNVFL